MHWYFVRNPQVQTSNSYSVNSTLNSDNPKERKSLNTEYTKAPPRVQTWNVRLLPIVDLPIEGVYVDPVVDGSLVNSFLNYPNQLLAGKVAPYRCYASYATWPTSSIDLDFRIGSNIGLNSRFVCGLEWTQFIRLQANWGWSPLVSNPG